MGIKAVLPSLDDVQDGFKEFYKETDGKYILDVEGFDDHPTVRGVIVANKANKDKRDELKGQVEALTQRLKGVPDDFDPDSYADMLERLEKNQAPDVDEKLAKQRAKLTEQHKKELDPLTEALSKKDATIHRLVVESSLATALDEARIDPDHREMVTSYIKEKAKFSVIEDGDTMTAVTENDLGTQTLQEFVSDWASSERAKNYISKSTGPKLRGGNGPGGTTTMSRSDWEALSNTDRSKFLSEGGKLV